MEISREVPRGSISALVLFKLFINDLELRVSSVVAKFSGDTKLFRIVKIEAVWEKLE